MLSNDYLAAAVYDALGRAVEIKTGSNYQEIVYGADGAKLAYMNGQSLLNAYEQLPKGALASFDSTGTLNAFGHPDWLGTQRVYSGPSGGVYTDVNYAPYGESYPGSPARFFTAVADNPLGSDIDSFPARELETREGRWLRPDPAGFAAADFTNPQTLNRYAYVMGNPLGVVDPTGMDTCQTVASGENGQPVCYDASNNGLTFTGGVTICDSFWCKIKRWFGGGPGTNPATDPTYDASNPGTPPGGSPYDAPCGSSTCAGGGGGGGESGENKGVFTCASEAASSVSLAGALHRFGIGNSGVGKFVTDALGGNAFSGATDLVKSFATGEDLAYNMGQSLVAGPTQGFGAAFGKGIEGTPWASGPVDVATGALVTKFMSVATGAGTLQTLNGTVKLGAVLGEGAEYATGFGEIKLGYDFLTYAGSLAGCAAGIIH